MHNALKMCCASSAIASLEHFNIMSHAVAPRRHTLLIYITLTLLSVMGVACGTIRPNDNYDISGMPTRTTRTPEDVWGHGKKTKREQPRQSTPPRDDNFSRHDEKTSIEQWKKLDIKLGRNDNRSLYHEIKSWLGTPHHDGMHTKQEGTDCSGFVMEIYLTVYNMKIERNSARIYSISCDPIDPNDLTEGDLVFFHGGSGNGITHVGIYLKDNMFAHASSSRGVVIDDLTARYYTEHFYAAGRVKGKKH